MIMTASTIILSEGQLSKPFGIHWFRHRAFGEAIPLEPQEDEIKKTILKKANGFNVRVSVQWSNKGRGFDGLRGRSFFVLQSVTLAFDTLEDAVEFKLRYL